MAIRDSEQVLEYWDGAADGFDAIYSGVKPSWAKFLDRWLRRDMYQRFEWAMRNSGDVKGRSVCDLGCGTGRYVVAYAQLNARVVGIDGSSNMVKRARELVEAAGVSGRAKVQQADILDFQTDQLFDVTLVMGVFDYVQDARPYLRKIRGMTAGVFLATFPRLWTWRMPMRKVRLGVLGCPVYFYTARRIKALLGESGFACDRIDRVGKLHCVVAVPKEGARA